MVGFPDSNWQYPDITIIKMRGRNIVTQENIHDNGRVCICQALIKGINKRKRSNKHLTGYKFGVYKFLHYVTSVLPSHSSAVVEN